MISEVEYQMSCTCKTWISDVHHETCHTVLEKRMYVIFSELMALNNHLLKVVKSNPDASHLLLGDESSVFWHDDSLEEASDTECLIPYDKMDSLKSLSFDEEDPTLKTIIEALTSPEKALTQLMNEVCSVDYEAGGSEAGGSEALYYGGGADMSKGFCESHKSKYYIELFHKETENKYKCT